MEIDFQLFFHQQPNSFSGIVIANSCPKLAPLWYGIITFHKFQMDKIKLFSKKKNIVANPVSLENTIHAAISCVTSQ